MLGGYTVVKVVSCHEDLGHMTNPTAQNEMTALGRVGTFVVRKDRSMKAGGREQPR